MTIMGIFDFSIDTNTYYQDPNDANIPPVLRTTTFTRSDQQKKGCREGGYWVSSTTKKRICLINRYDYKYTLKEPVYPCELEKRSTYDRWQAITPAGCRPDHLNGTLGRLFWWYKIALKRILQLVNKSGRNVQPWHTRVMNLPGRQ